METVYEWRLCVVFHLFFSYYLSPVRYVTSAIALPADCGFVFFLIRLFSSCKGLHGWRYAVQANESRHTCALRYRYRC